MPQESINHLPEPRKFKKVLITGISGSGGSFLAEHLVRLGNIEIHGMSRWHTANVDNLKAIRNEIHMHEADLTDTTSIINVLKKVEPDGIINLASYANVRTSFETPTAVMYNNVMGTTNFFEAIRALDMNPIIQHCSTSEVYGQVDPKHVPIKEDTPFKPASPYAISKATQDHLAWYYHTAHKMPIFRTRMFTYLNPRRPDIFASAFAKQVARIEIGLQDELVHGNLDSIRTMIDVRDAMSAYWDAMLYCEPGEVYNIGGTKTMKVGDFLEQLIKLSTVDIKTRLDKNLLRPADVTLQIPSVDKFTEQTGWKTKYSFEESMQFLLDFWRNQAQIDKNNLR